jgi:uncharacterized membrane protein YwaF
VCSYCILSLFVIFFFYIDHRCPYINLEFHRKLEVEKITKSSMETAVCTIFCNNIVCFLINNYLVIFS